MENPPVSQDNPTVKVFKYRWISLVIFCLFTIINFLQFLQFSIISTIVTEFYQVDSFAVDLTGLIFFVVYILLFLPVSYLIEKYSLRVTAIVSSGLTLAGNLAKLLCAQPDRFYVVLIGQGLCALGQVYMMSIPSKFASVWFGPEEVSTATAIAVLGTQLGVAIGSALPPVFVHANQTSEKTGEELFNMLMYNASASAVMFLIVLLFFRAKPPLPPSQSQLNLLESSEGGGFIKIFKTLMRNKDFMVLLLSFGLCNGLWNAFGIVINQMYTSFFPGGETDAGFIVLMAIIAGGCIGSVVFGLVLDKTHQFKKTSAAVFVASSLSFIAVIWIFQIKSRVGSFLTIPIFGFFTASTLAIGFEFAIEVTYPTPEAISCSILNAAIFFLAIILTVVVESLIDAIGYLYTQIVALVVLLFCSANIWLISNKLLRRDANKPSAESQTRL